MGDIGRTIARERPPGVALLDPAPDARDPFPAGPDWIHAFREPGEVLRFCHARLKREWPGASHRYLAAALEMKSPAAFNQIVAGRINPDSRLIDRLARLFGLDREERDYLAILFSLRHMKDRAARDLILGYVRGRPPYPNHET